MFEGKNILVTGGTGSFGRAFIAFALKNLRPARIVIYSRDEMKQWLFSNQLGDDPRLQFVIGDVRDAERLSRSMTGINFVVHAAATKIVPTAEANPRECVKTNIDGALNVVEASLQNNVECVVSLSTDKASNPVNLYGATKLASDKIFIAANLNSELSATKFSVVRYGNVMGSRGSVIPYFKSLVHTGVLPVTHKEMTRFFITLPEAIDLVINAFQRMNGGEVFVRKNPSINILDIAKAVCPTCEIKFTGIRPGEKLHEQMIGLEDACFTLEFGKFYTIYSPLLGGIPSQKPLGSSRVPEQFIYASDSNKDWLSAENLATWIANNENTFLDI